MQREYHKWWSPRLGRDMELLVFGHAGAKVLVFPTRDGRFHEYEDLRLTEVLRPKIEQGLFQLYCVDSLDWESFYCFWCHPAGRIRRHLQFEEYILQEVVPFMHGRNPHPCMIAHGCSLGAFHAANIAFRHPHLFHKMVALSGRFDLTLSVESFRDLFDGFYSPDIYFHSPTHFLPNLECPWRLRCLRRMEIIVVIGEEDPFRPNNELLSSILGRKEIGHRLLFWPGRAHQGSAWRRMIPHYL